MTNGGVIARIGYRYQDQCALYFLMHEYMSGGDFEVFYTELDEIDFETQHSDHILSYQAKTNGRLSADAINKLINKHQKRIQTFKKNSGKIIFLSEADIPKALHHLIIGSPGNKIVNRYRTTALSGNDERSLVCESKSYSKKDIQRMLYGLIDEFLKKIRGNDDYPSFVIDKFYKSLIAELITISCEVNENSRSLDKNGIENIITRFAGTTAWRNERKKLQQFSFTPSNPLVGIPVRKLPISKSVKAKFHE